MTSAEGAQPHARLRADVSRRGPMPHALTNALHNCRSNGDPRAGPDVTQFEPTSHGGRAVDQPQSVRYATVKAAGSPYIIVRFVSAGCQYHDLLDAYERVALSWTQNTNSNE